MSSGPEMPLRREPRSWAGLGAFLLCFVAGFLVYWPALAGERIWDDAYLVGENPFFRSPVFSLEVFRHWLFFDSLSTYYRPVQNWSYMLDYWLWNGDTFGYHLTNVLLHCTSGFLLYLLLRRLLPALVGEGGSRHLRLIALLVAVVWTVHPVHNAAVAYISGRADSLASVFALSAWLLALRARTATRGGSRGAFAILAGCSALLALCSKEIAFVWLGLFAFHTLAFERSSKRGDKLFQLALVGLVIGAYAFLHSLPERRVRAEEGPPPELPARALLMFRALGDYTGLMVWPGELHMERSLSDPVALGSGKAWRERIGYEYLSVLGFLTGLAAFFTCRWEGPAPGLRRFGVAWFAIAFLPISNLFPLNAEVAEHWIYLASIGFLLVGAGCVLAMPRRLQPFAGAVVVCAIVALGMRTSIRAGDWVNAERFCQRTIASGGGSPRLLSTLADIYAQRGEVDKQERLLRKTLERFPQFVPARFALGGCLQRQGRNEEAAGFLNQGKGEALGSPSHYPRTWTASLHLARLRVDAGETEEALTMLRTARAHFPEVWELVRYEAGLLRRDGEKADATSLVGEFAGGHWWHAEARLTLAELRTELGDTDGALADLRHASRLDLYDPRPFAAIARLELARNRGEAAIEAQCTAISRQPQRAESYLALAAIFEQLGRQSEAEAAVRRARSLFPDIARL